MAEEKRPDFGLVLKKLKQLTAERAQDVESLDPMMRAIKAVHSVTNAQSTAPEDLERQRAGQELFGKLVAPSVGIRTEAFTLGSSLPAEWVSVVAGHDRRHVVLYCHGGGYTCGQLGYARILASKLALATGCDVLAFEYRLAPENPYPAAVQDALAAWDHLMYMGYGARDVIVAGDSAGGNLALELALKIKEQGRRQPRAMVLMSPWTDMTASGESYRTNVDIDPLITLDYISAVRMAYAGQADWAKPCYSPLFGDLRGLSPTLIQVGTHEILRSDSEQLYQKLIEQGAYATLEVYEECWHVFQQMPIRQATLAMDSIGRFVQRQF
ncbi:MAG: alpha/beta hydrolase [Gemmiger sp.]|nr:alpha/beta hydrolase [Gemmiger sp.]